MLHQSQRQSQLQQQKLSPQQIQGIKLLEIPTMELNARIDEELEINPALEDEKDENEEEQNEDTDTCQEEISDKQEDELKETDQNDDFDINDYFNEDEYSNYKESTNNSSPDQDDNREIPFSVGDTFQENLKSQIQLLDLSEHEQEIADFLIGNIDEDGYLRRDLESISDDILLTQNISISVAELSKVLKAIQTLDPAGIGATNLQECLLLQLDRKQRTPVTVTARAVLQDYYDEYVRRHYEKIRSSLEIEDADLRDAIELIQRLNPKPGNGTNDPYAKTTSHAIVPDFMLEEQNGEMLLSLNGKNVPNLRVSRAYKQMLLDYKPTQKSSQRDREAFEFIKQKVDSAKWFIDAIKNRNDTLLSTMQVIYDYQKDFFTSGDRTRIKPMILKDIADKTGLDISTISRVSNSKFIQTPYGIFSLKSFFSESMQTQSGEEVSTLKIKEILQETIAEENKKKPCTDEQLAAILKKEGFNVARRTIAKYREQLGIPTSSMRKEI